MLLLAQALVLAVLWMGTGLLAWIRALLRRPMLVMPDAIAARSVLIVGLAPALAAPLSLLWHSWRLHVGWPASQTEVVSLAGGWFLSFVGVAVLPLVTFVVVALAAAAWRRYRRRHINAGLAAETMALLRSALPMAVLVTVVVYALALIPLLDARAHAEALTDSVLLHGEMSLLR